MARPRSSPSTRGRDKRNKSEIDKKRSPINRCPKSTKITQERVKSKDNTSEKLPWLVRVLEPIFAGPYQYSWKWWLLVIGALMPSVGGIIAMYFERLPIAVVLAIITTVVWVTFIVYLMLSPWRRNR